MNNLNSSVDFSHKGIMSYQESFKELVPKDIKDVILKSDHESLKKQFLFSKIENDKKNQKFGQDDPISDNKYKATPHLIHRYPNKVLFLPTTICTVHCRYCFRKNLLDTPNIISLDQFESVITYLKERPQINEVIFSGGDPFSLAANKIHDFLEGFSKIDHLKFVRFHTRVPTISPEIISDKLLNTLDRFKTKFNQINLVLHINHRDELTVKAHKSIKKLQEIVNKTFMQTVLLKGVNNNVITLKDLFLQGVYQNISPYYLHHPDKVLGGMHFYMTPKEGIAIYHQLLALLPGWAVPRYVIDNSKGEGKIDVSAYLLHQSKDKDKEDVI